MRVGFLVVLIACLTACKDHRGEIEEQCKPDGTCIGTLACVRNPSGWGHEHICSIRESCNTKCNR